MAFNSDVNVKLLRIRMKTRRSMKRIRILSKLKVKVNGKTKEEDSILSSWFDTYLPPFSSVESLDSYSAIVGRCEP